MYLKAEFVFCLAAIFFSGCRFATRDAPGLISGLSGVDGGGDADPGDTYGGDASSGDTYAGDAGSGDTYGGDAALAGDSSLPAVARVHIVAPAYATVGQQVVVTLYALDDADDVVQAFSGSVELAVSGSATGGGLVELTGGAGIAQITDGVAETVTLSMKDTKGLGIDVSDSAKTAFLQASADSLLLTLTPEPYRVGVPVGVTVEVLLAGGATNTAYRGTVVFSTTDPLAEVPSSYTFTDADAGVHAFPEGAVFYTLGSTTLTVDDTGGAAASSTLNLTVEVGRPASLALGGPEKIRADACSGPFEVTTLDAGGYQAPVEIDTTVSLTPSGSVQFWDNPTCLSANIGGLTFKPPSSLEQFWLLEAAPGAVTLGASHAVLTGASLAVQVVARPTPQQIALYIANDFDGDGATDTISTDEVVSKWPDISGNGHAVVQLPGPSLPIRTASNGSLVVRFDGVDDNLFWFGPAWGSMPSEDATAGMTIVVVRDINTSGPAAFCSLYGLTPSDPVLIFGLDERDHAWLGLAGGETHVSADAVATSRAVQAVSIDNVTRRARIFVDGVQVSSVAIEQIAHFSTTQRFTLGAAWTTGPFDTWQSTRHLSGDLTHVEVFDQPLEPGEIDTRTTELRREYGF